MRWEVFCDRYDTWAESTLIKKIYSLEDLESADDVVDIASVLPQSAASALIKKAFEQGTSFTAFDFGELQDLIDSDLYMKLVDKYISEHEDMSVDEITDFAYYAGVEASDKLVRYTLESGKIYSPVDIVKFDTLVSQRVIDEMLQSALDAEVKITAEDIEDLDKIASRQALNKAIGSVKGRIPVDDMEMLDGVVDKAILIGIDKKQGTRVYYQPPKPKQRVSYIFRGNRRKNTSLLLLPLLLLFWPIKLFIDIFLVLFSSGGRKKKETELRVGDHVWINDYDLYGVIVHSNGKELLVSVHDGERVYSVYDSDVTKTF